MVEQKPEPQADEVSADEQVMPLERTFSACVRRGAWRGLRTDFVICLPLILVAVWGALYPFVTDQQSNNDVYQYDQCALVFSIASMLIAGAIVGGAIGALDWLALRMWGQPTELAKQLSAKSRSKAKRPPEYYTFAECLLRGTWAGFIVSSVLIMLNLATISLGLIYQWRSVTNVYDLVTSLVVSFGLIFYGISAFTLVGAVVGALSYPLMVNLKNERVNFTQ